MPKIKPTIKQLEIKKKIAALAWNVASDSRDAASHEVTFIPETKELTCTCEAFKFAASKISGCKHIDFIKEVGEY